MENKMKSSSVEKKSRSDKSNDDSTKKSQEAEKNREKKLTITLGVCAMKKKVQSKPMKQILSRLKCPEIEIIEMWQFLDDHWSLWPIVDALICFHSDGFPFLMACQYVQKHKPFLINSLQKQQLLWDRTVVYDLLKKIKVPVAKHYYIFRDKNYVYDIELRGNGKIVQPPSQTQSESQTAKLDKHGSQTQSIQQTKKTRKLKQHRFSSLDQQSKNDGSFTTKKEGNYLHPIGEQQEIQKSKTHLNDEPASSTQIHFSPKSKHRYSDCINSEQIIKSYPSLLRSFHERRKDKILNYEVEEVEDHLVIKYGQEVHKLKKPFVEKPFDAENHQICIYYPESMGGGRKKLFRKVKDCSSQYQTNQNSIRRDGNYIYEQFLPTNAFDIKVYTIGPYYMYAEARKSPTLDGVVQRNEEGKEMRFPVNLTPAEKFMCNRIVQQFQQEVCGFDLLRANGKSYVCDVNGWSFVKSNPKYWQDCSTILKKKIFYHFFPQKIHLHPNFHNFFNSAQNELKLPMDRLNPKLQQLRSIVSIFRHGDRSPKLKLKIKTKDKRFIELFNGSQKDELKFKDAKNLTKILQITNNIIAESDQKDSVLKEFLNMKIVLESGGHFEGLTRKLQLKVSDRYPPQEGSTKGPIKTVLIVLKWGGQLSFFGYQDAIELGKKMRTERYDDRDCLSLYSSYKHDIKTYASDQGRCIKTAAAFLKGFLSIEGELAPIISSLVKADHKAQRLLDCTSMQNHSNFADQLQVRLYQMLNSEQQLQTFYRRYCGEVKISNSMEKIIKSIGKPRQKLYQLLQLIKELVIDIQRIFMENWEQEGLSDRISHHQYLDDEEKCEDIHLVNNRWSKIKKDFYDSDSKKFNVTKIPQIYDTIRHDLRKNGLIFNLIEKQVKQGILELSKKLAYFFVINQYGITDQQRVRIAKDICLPLLEKISVDLMFWKQKNIEQNFLKYADQEEQYNERHIRTRLYFTSASHMYSLLNILTLGQNRYLLSRSPPEDAQKVVDILYMGYLSHIEFRLYQNLVLTQNHPNRFRLQISFSTQYKKQKTMIEFSLGGHGFTIQEINDFIKSFILTKTSSKSKSKDSGNGASTKDV